MKRRYGHFACVRQTKLTAVTYQWKFCQTST